MRYEFTRFMSRISDDELETLWTFSGFGFDPESGESHPRPGRSAMARFLEPIPGSWRDILRRAVRTMGIRRDLAALRALLRALVSGYVEPVPNPAPTPRILTPQWRCHRVIPARAP